MSEHLKYPTTKLYEGIKSHLALIFSPKDGWNGSGVLIELHGRYFVLTAAHVIDKDFEVNLGIPKQQTRFTVLHKWTDKSLDVGFIELEPIEVKFLLGRHTEPYVIRAQQKTSAKYKITTYALCGFPTVMAQLFDSFTRYKMMFISTPIISPNEWPTSVANLKTPDRHFLIPYGAKHRGQFIDRGKGAVKRPDPHGLSGCGLWHYETATEESDDPVYSLVGIQQGYFEHDQCLVGSFLPPIIASIQKKCGIVIEEDNAVA